MKVKAHNSLCGIFIESAGIFGLLKNSGDARLSQEGGRALPGLCPCDAAEARSACLRTALVVERLATEWCLWGPEWE